MPIHHHTLIILSHLIHFQAMKVHHLPRGLIWDLEPPSLTLGCKRFHPLATKLSAAAAADNLSATTFDLRSFIKQPQCSPTKQGSSNAHHKHDSPKAAESGQVGGTRWNPTQEQIGILEMLYRSGMRTPNSQQIEQITGKLAKYGKIEGKNVFYWFQNHKARERQKQKRNTTTLSLHSHSPPPPPTSSSSLLFLSSSSSSSSSNMEEDDKRNKRRCMSWDWELDESLEEVKKYCGEDKTLLLFPLHPQGKGGLASLSN